MNGNRPIYLVAGVCAFFATIVLGLYTWNFGRWPLSDDPQHWGVFGDYVGGVLNPLLGVVNISVVIYLAYRIRELERQQHVDAEKLRTDADTARQRSEQRQNAVRLLDTVQSLQFYKEVGAPVWEVAVKWRYWTGTQGAQYRLSVVTGFVSFSDHYAEFSEPQELRMSGHNVIRFGDHYHPSDYSTDPTKPGYTQTVLSEHQALTCWLEYWGNINTMINKGLADADTVRDLLGDWYHYWVDFMVEFRWIVRALHICKKRNPDGLGTALPEPQPRWIKETKALEKVLYSGTEGLTWERYLTRKRMCENRARSTLEELRPLLTQTPTPSGPSGAEQQPAADGAPRRR